MTNHKTNSVIQYIGLRIFYYIIGYSQKKVQKPSLGLYLFKRENFCPF